MRLQFHSEATAIVGAKPNRWDLVAFPLIIGLLALLGFGAHETWKPMATLQTPVISLDPVNLPYYALRTFLRMLAAMFASLFFTLTYATLAAKSRRWEMVLIPVLDILQSVPILGFLSFTVTFFLGLFPGNTLGAELAAITRAPNRHFESTRFPMATISPTTSCPKTAGGRIIFA